MAESELKCYAFESFLTLHELTFTGKRFVVFFSYTSILINQLSSCKNETIPNIILHDLRKNLDNITQIACHMKNF